MHLQVHTELLYETNQRLGQTYDSVGTLLAQVTDSPECLDHFFETECRFFFEACQKCTAGLTRCLVADGG